MVLTGIGVERYGVIYIERHGQHICDKRLKINSSNILVINYNLRKIKMEDRKKHLMVAALDFGTTYSGYAFSMKGEFKKDPLNIHPNPIWESSGRAVATLKTPTCLLLNKDKKFVAFGYDAENQYADIVMDGKIDDYYYFHRFKMNLHNNKNITSEMVVEDVKGNPLLANEIFRFSIQALVNHLIQLLDKRGTGVRKDEVQWVLTVPAIWTDTAKQFMRSSAEKAGIPKDMLLLALEPETASIYCQYLPTEKITGTEEGFTMTKEGTEYMVVDLGGGTADITVHQKMSSGQLKEKHRASGNDGGGTSVDNRFLKMLEEIVGEKVMNSFKDEDPLAYLDLIREFEAVKRTLKSDKTTKVNLTIPFTTINDKCKENCNKDFHTLLKESAYSEKVTIYKDKLRVEADLMKEMFKPTTKSIVILMKEILSNASTKDVTHLLMVGGFSECEIIQDAVRQAFPNKRIIIPEDAGMTVLKGAVLFGHRPDYIKSRVMRVTYGIKTNVPFDGRKHDSKHLVEMDDEAKCDNIFSKIVEKDETVEAGTVVKREYFTPYKNQEVMDFIIYTCERHHPFYVTDEGCKLLCKPTIIFPEVCEDKRWVDVEYIFGKTEIELKAVDRKSKKEIKAQFNLI